MTIGVKRAWLLGTLVFVSLALNFTFAGIMLGRGRMCPPPPPPHERGWDPMRSMERRLEALPSEAQEQAMAIMGEYRAQLQAQMEEIKLKRKEAFGFIKSEAYERPEAETRLRELGEEYRDMQVISQQMMLDLADQLTPEQRAKMFKRERPQGHRPPPPPQD